MTVWDKDLSLTVSMAGGPPDPPAVTMMAGSSPTIHRAPVRLSLPKQL